MTPQPCFNPALIGQEIDQTKRSGPLQSIVIPSCPQALVRMRDLLAQDDPDLDEVVRIARSDVAMAATLIQSANTAAFSSQQPVQAIGQAISRLGLAHTARVMTTHLLRQAVRVTSPHLSRFWERATLGAQIMQRMAREVPRLNEDEGYTYGLFVDVGRAVMVQSLPGYAATLVEIGARADANAIELENASHRTDHAVVGALVARLWRLAPTVMAAIRRHHDLDTLGQGDGEPAVHTLVAAGLVAEHLMGRREALPDTWEWEHHGAAALDWLGVSADDVLDWEDQWLPQLETV